MTKTFKVIKIEDYGVVVDDTEIKKGDWFITKSLQDDEELLWANVSQKCLGVEGTRIYTRLPNQKKDGNGRDYTDYAYCDNWRSKKIIYSVGKRLDSVPLIELVDNNLAKFIDEGLDSFYMNGSKEDGKYILTLSQATDALKEIYKANTNKYSEEDIEKAIRYGFDVGFCSNSSNNKKNNLQSKSGFIQSLQKQPIPTEVELEMEEVGVIANDNTPMIKNGKFLYINQPVIHNLETDTITAVNYKT